MTILEAAAALRTGKTTSVALTRQSLEAIEQLNPQLNAFQTVAAGQALDRAALADLEMQKGEWLGTLHGIPVAVKDVFETAGIRTTCGSLLFRDFVPDRNAAVVERLHAAGAVIVGKTTLHELAYGITSNNPHFGPVRNPWNTGRIPGGSSGGSGAAVASEVVFMAMGTDTGGSIRIPASFCGTVGLKPTFGRVSRYGVMPLDFSLDHMGPLTRSVRDAAVVLQALAGFDERDDTSSRHPVPQYMPSEGGSLEGLRVGIPENYYFEYSQPEVADAVRAMAATAERLGAHLIPVHVPDIDEINAVARVILLAEASALMQPFLDRRDQFGPDVLALLEQGQLLPATDYVNAQRLRRMMQRDFARLWDQVDCLFTPATPATAPPIGATTATVAGKTEDVRLTATRFARSINLLGLPALALPCGLDSEGLPMGLQIIGRPFEEAVLLRAGAALEDATDFHLARPPVSSKQDIPE